MRLIGPLLGVPALLGTLSLSVGLIESSPQPAPSDVAGGLAIATGTGAPAIGLHRDVSVVTIRMPAQEPLFDAAPLTLEASMQQARIFPSPETVRGVR